MHGSSWLLADVADEDDFWGPWQRMEGDRLTLVFPERDAELGTRLSSELDLMLIAVCKAAVVACPDEFQLVVRLNRSQRSLMSLHEGVYAMRILSFYGPDALDLPAPTIVGRPVDEAGYNALFQRYSSWLAAVMLTNFASEKEFIDEPI